MECESEVSIQRRRFWFHSDMTLGRWSHVPAPVFNCWTSCYTTLFPCTPLWRIFKTVYVTYIFTQPRSSFATNCILPHCISLLRNIDISGGRGASCWFFFEHCVQSKDKIKSLQVCEMSGVWCDVWDEVCEMSCVWDTFCDVCVRVCVWDECCVRWVVCEMSGVWCDVWDEVCEMSCVWDTLCDVCVRVYVWDELCVRWVVWDE